MNVSEELLKIIDERIEKKLRENNFLKTYNAKVSGIINKEIKDDSGNVIETIITDLKVKLIGYTKESDMEYQFPNKTGFNDIQINDIVKIECNNGQISSGYITINFGHKE